MKMENGTETTSASSMIPYANGTAKHQQSQQQMTNAVSMESLDSVISASNGGGSGDQVRTLFVSGLPIDVKPRELYLLFRAYSGYESSQLKLTPSGKNGALSKTSTPVGFVTFATRQDADEARKKLQGVRFDPEQQQTIRLELARSNTKVTKPTKQPSPPTHQIGTASATNPVAMPPALLPPPAPAAVLSHNMAAVAQLAALQQQQQLAAAAVLLNQQNHHHDPATSSSANGSLAHQQQQQLALAAAALEQQRHLPPLLGGANGSGPADMQQQLAALAAVNNGTNPVALAAFSHHHHAAQQQAQAMQQLLQHQQNASAAAAAALLGVPTLPGAATTANSHQHLAVVAAQLAAVQHQQHPAAHSTANGAAGAHWTTSVASNGGCGGTMTAPCSTIFIGNLGPLALTAPQTVEDELRSLFSMFPGFSRIRMHAKSGAPVAFVEFMEVGQAMAAMHAMQGYCLAANGGGTIGAAAGNGGIRIEFAKTRMGDTGQMGKEQRGGDGMNGK